MRTTGPDAARASVSDSTSTQRTHRYLRLAIGGAVVIILISIALTVPAVGWLASISDYFYTPARNAFVGALIATSLALLALSAGAPNGLSSMPRPCSPPSSPWFRRSSVPVRFPASTPGATSAFPQSSCRMSSTA